jgi:hypothetical protein
MPIERPRDVPFGMLDSRAVRRVGIGSITEYARPNGETAWGASVGDAMGTGMTDQRHDYRGYRIDIRRHADGWRATIYAPDSNQPMLGPQTDGPTEGLDKAKAFIDALLSS